MPQTGAARSGEIQRHAEHTHEKAAVSHEQNDHLSPHEQTQQEHERERLAHLQAEKLKSEKK